MLCPTRSNRLNLLELTARHERKKRSFVGLKSFVSSSFTTFIFFLSSFRDQFLTGCWNAIKKKRERKSTMDFEKWNERLIESIKNIVKYRGIFQTSINIYLLRKFLRKK